MTTSRPCLVTKTDSGDSQTFSHGSSSSIHSAQHILEKFHIGGAIKSTRPIFCQPPPQKAAMFGKHSNRSPLNRSLTGPTTLESPTENDVTPGLNRRFDVIRSVSRTTAIHRSTSAHPDVPSLTRSKAAPIRVLSLAQSIPETYDGDDSTENAAKKRSRSASSIDTCRQESPKQLLAFVFSGGLPFAADDDWTCSNGVHRILNLSGVPSLRSANCKCSDSSKGKKKEKQELVITVNEHVHPRKIASYFTTVNKFIAKSRSAASKVLVCHDPDQAGYCIAFVIQYIIAYHQIPLNRAIGHCKALQDVEMLPNAMEALRIWESEKFNEAKEPKMPPPRSEDFKWVQVARPVKLAWC